ncbi:MULTISPECIES: ABC transporter permease [Halorussus]|uniref:ABC transporter permease n=1 Tax=Halorussus TaxID=1070314 RepID=UPI000E20D19A|nr:MULTISPECIES: ABC transporter permease [Halorussus]NHN61463.1 ABC transporter permease [Halorussus sp. JP-T4]
MSRVERDAREATGSGGGHGGSGGPGETGFARRVAAAFAMGLREYARTPVLLALLVFLPAYFVGLLVYLLPESSVPIEAAGAETVVVQSAELYGILLVPLTSALVGGIAGLFLMLNARDADGRLVVAGYRPSQLLLARVGLLAVAAGVAVGVSLVVLSVEVVPERLGWFVAASVLAGLTYGLFGALAGLALSRLAGVYFLLFAPMVDVFFFQNPMVSDAHWLAACLPGRFVTEAAVDAGFSASVSLEPLGWAVAYLVGVGVVTGVAYYRSMRLG